jgi:hypothetical protein
MSVDHAASMRLRIIAESDPSSLIRALQLLQARNVVPRRVTAVRIDVDLIEIAIDVDTSECTLETLGRIAARLNELPIVIESELTPA